MLLQRNPPRADIDRAFAQAAAGLASAQALVIVHRDVSSPTMC